MSNLAVPDPRNVFVVHGRNHEIRESLYSFLRAIDLRPLAFQDATIATGKAAPYVGEILDAVFAKAQAVVVLFTPDDEARLSPVLVRSEDPPHERDFTPQARPNVLFEAGMALAKNPDRTILVEIGTLRPFSDIAGRHVVRLANDSVSRQALAQRLQVAGCPVDLSTSAWHTAGDFALPSARSKASHRKVAEKTSKSVSAPSDDELRILQFLAEDREEDAIPSSTIAGAMKMSEERVWYHLESLRDTQFVTQVMNLISGHRWCLSQKGRAYLFKRGLLK